MAFSNENVSPVVFLSLSNLARNYTTTFSYTQAKNKPHTAFAQNPRYIQMQGVT